VFVVGTHRVVLLAIIMISSLLILVLVLNLAGASLAGMLLQLPLQLGQWLAAYLQHLPQPTDANSSRHLGPAALLAGALAYHCHGIFLQPSSSSSSSSSSSDSLAAGVALTIAQQITKSGLLPALAPAMDALCMAFSGVWTQQKQGEQQQQPPQQQQQQQQQHLSSSALLSAELLELVRALCSTWPGEQAGGFWFQM
jgi:hypothetical protein